MRYLLLRLSLVLLVASPILSDSSFFEVDGEFRRRNRELLQENNAYDEETVGVREEEEGEGRDKEEERKEEPRKSSCGSEKSHGPELFYDGGNFLMKVKTGIVVNVFETASNSSRPVAKIRLNRPAVSVKGGVTKVDGDTFTISLEWKGARIEAEVGSMTLDSIIIKMTFSKKPKDFVLSHLMATQTVVDGQNLLNIGMKGATQQGGYQNGYQGGYQNGNQGGYQSGNQGGYQRVKRYQDGSKGGYLSGSQGGYQQRGSQGGYQQSGSQGVYQSGSQGGYQNNYQSGYQYGNQYGNQGQKRVEKGFEMKVVSKNGYKVKAPLGLSFCCDDPGMFMPERSESGTNKFSIGLSLPELRLQVFNVPSTCFGPSWFCGELMSIGLWVGLLVSLAFTIICFYGMSMLASINTMDRFDDPKGKPIHVPNSD